jgi:hypothetical protein
LECGSKFLHKQVERAESFLSVVLHCLLLKIILMLKWHISVSHICIEKPGRSHSRLFIVGSKAESKRAGDISVFWVFFFIWIFFFCSSGIWIQDHTLGSWVFYHLSPPPAFFCVLDNFKIGSCFLPRLVLNLDSPDLCLLSRLQTWATGTLGLIWFFFFFSALGLELRAYTFSHSTTLFL